MNRLWVRLAIAFVLVTWAVLAIVAVVVYGLDNGSEGLYVVFDLGGGIFDISLF